MPVLRGLTIQRVLVVIGAGWLVWLAVTVGMTGIARFSNPKLALQFSPGDSRALSTLADAMLVENYTPARLAAAAALSRAAIARDPTSAVALRILGFTAPAANQPRYFALASKLTRRDLAVQIWLIENAVDRGDAPAALMHYDIALRTSDAAPPLLFPVLSAASADAALAPEIARTIARKPEWAVPFLFELVNDAPSPDRLVDIFRVAKRSGIALPPALLDNLTRRTLRDERFDLTRQAYFIAGGTSPAVGSRVANGDFAREPQNLPFDWEFASEPDVFTSRSAGDRADDFRLSVQAADGVSGDAVKQMLALVPGRYRLSVKAGNIPAAKVARVSARLACAKQPGVVLHDTVLAPASAAGQVSISSFSVTKACDAQWLSLRVSTQTDGDGVDAWIDSIAIDRVSG